MRKFIKERTLTLTTRMEEAHATVEQMIRAQDYDGARNVLASCQKAALSIGTTLENEDDDTVGGITELEAYCENLYDLSLTMQRENGNIDEAFRVLNARMSVIKNYIRDQIKIHYEVAFLPYEASMWDSMESVWKAAEADPECKCFVVPIPYFKRTVTSGTQKPEYDGTLLPDYVAVTHYEQYSLKDRKPDIIYIHNPFDDCNTVTSVHPAFYSFELKKYTSLLVYIPYYVTGGSDSKTLQSLPVHQHMDKMVVQGNKALKFYKETIPAEKLVALGSPKVDRIYSVLNRKSEVPLEWTELIGSRKVIFYNTSISGSLGNGDKELDKMESVFSVFRSRKKEVLLWRPHPLLKATLQIMRPDLYQRYCELERSFLAEKIGILDTTPDIAQSIAMSDAYIGEKSSSVVHLFGVSGKPIFILDTELNQEKREAWQSVVGAMDAHLEDDDLWFMHSHYNALCKMDVSTGKAVIIGSIPGEPTFGERLYHDVLKMGGKLYFAPNRAKEIAVYDMNTGQFGKVACKDTSKALLSKFNRIIRYHDNLVFIPTHYPALLKLDTATNEITYHSDVMSAIKKYANKNQSTALVINAVCVENELLLMASSRSNIIAEYDMDTGKINIHKVGSKENTYMGMTYDGNDYWLIPHESKAIVKWNRKTGNAVEYTDFPEGFRGDKNAFVGIVSCGDFVYVFPKFANMILKIDSKTGGMTEYQLSLPYKEGDRKEPHYNWPNNYYWVKKLDDTTICALSAYDCSLLTINTETQECSVKKCVVDKKRFPVEFDSHGDILPYAAMETYFTDLDDFMSELDDGKSFDSEKQKAAYASVIKNMDGSCGGKIHEYMIKTIKSDKTV